MPAGYGIRYPNVSITVDGHKVECTHIDTICEMDQMIQYRIEGYEAPIEQKKHIRDYVQAHHGYHRPGKRPGTYDATTDKYTFTALELQHFMEQQEGGEDMASFERSTMGSYGYALKCLAEGLQGAVDSGWLTDEEAKEEFRTHVNVVKEKDNREAYIQHLESQIEELRKGKPALMPAFKQDIDG